MTLRFSKETELWEECKWIVYVIHVTQHLVRTNRPSNDGSYIIIISEPNPVFDTRKWRSREGKAMIRVPACLGEGLLVTEFLNPHVVERGGIFQGLLSGH